MINSIRYLRLFTSLHLTVVFIPHHLSMIQLRQLVDFILIEITPLEEPLGCHKKLLIGWLLGVGNDTINYNMKIIMSGFSRKLVLLLVTIIWQSSLGTNAIQSSGQSLGQNGYIKYSNGLLMQWGTRAGATGGAISLYFPTTFYNTDYNIYFTGAVNNTSESFIYAPGYDLNGKYTSYCKVLTRGINSTPAIVWTGWNFTWFAIGRWK
nr:MAG TPA: putative tail fiber protein [Caudoviricetes sp.]